MTDPLEVLTFQFPATDGIPNNPHLPVVVYRNALDLTGEALAEELEKRFFQGDWHAAWRWGMYPFPHYHSTAHEVLGIYRGHATVRLGHTTGTTLEVKAGDVLILPAGTGHQKLDASADFHVIGGYPDGQEADLLRDHPQDRPAADQRIAKVPLPQGDPIFGPNGPLQQHWNL